MSVLRLSRLLTGGLCTSMEKRLLMDDMKLDVERGDSGGKEASSR